MQTVQKFTTFEELKHSEDKAPKDEAASVKKHSDFEKVMTHIRSVKAMQDKTAKQNRY